MKTHSMKMLLKPKKNILAFGLSLIACVALADAAPKPEAAKAEGAPAGKPKIKFDKIVYDFGKTSVVEQVAGKFTFENVGDGELKVSKPTTSCGCTVAAVKPDVLKPGEKGELSFTLNLGKSRATLE